MIGCLAIKILSYKYNASTLHGEIDVDHVTVQTNKETGVSLETNHKYLLIIWWYIKIVCLLVSELKIWFFFFLSQRVANVRVNCM